MQSYALLWTAGTVCLIVGGGAAWWRPLRSTPAPVPFRLWFVLLVAGLTTLFWFVLWVQHFGAIGGEGSDASQSVSLVSEPHQNLANAPVVLVLLGVALALASHLRSRRK